MTSLPRLFAVSGSKKWRGVRIRFQLCKYMACLGFGHNMPKRYCKDDAPPGWPILADWSKFKGPSQNCSLALCTEIICQMLEAPGLNLLQHGPCQAAEEAAAAESEGDEVEDVPVKKIKREKNIGVMK